MTTVLATKPDAIDPALIERVLIHGDLRQLTPAQKVSYYKAVCESVGLNPLTQPFQYLVLNGKEILYATRAATEQLRQVHAVSVQIMAREVVEDCYVVTARAMLASGRQDENIGAVPIANLKGEARANAMMKAETKAKRRVTLAICGLGMLDETEVATIPGAPGYVVEAPAPSVRDVRENAAAPPAGEPRGTSDNGPDLAVDLPAGARLIVKVETTNVGASKGRIYFNAEVEGGRCDVLTYKDQIVGLATEFCQNRTPCFPELKKSATGNWRVESLMSVPDNYDPPKGLPQKPIDAGSIPF